MTETPPMNKWANWQYNLVNFEDLNIKIWTLPTCKTFVFEEWTRQTTTVDGWNRLKLVVEIHLFTRFYTSQVVLAGSINSIPTWVSSKIPYTIQSLNFAKKPKRSKRRFLEAFESLVSVQLEDHTTWFMWLINHGDRKSSRPGVVLFPFQTAEIYSFCTWGLLSNYLPTTGWPPRFETCLLLKNPEDDVI